MTADEEILKLKRQIVRLMGVINEVSEAIATDYILENEDLEEHYQKLLMRIDALAVYNGDDIDVSQEMARIAAAPEHAPAWARFAARALLVLDWFFPNAVERAWSRAKFGIRKRK